jgi:hypothetical protein
LTTCGDETPGVFRRYDELSEQRDTLLHSSVPKLANDDISMERLDERALELIRETAKGSEAEIDKEVIIRTAEQLQALAAEQGAQTALEHCRSLLADNIEKFWLLHILAADLCLQQKDYDGYDAHLKQLVGHAKPDALAVGLWRTLLNLFIVRIHCSHARLRGAVAAARRVCEGMS